MKNQVNTKAYTQKAIYIKQCKRSFFWLYVKLQTTKTYLLPLYTKPSISYKINQKLYLVFIITLTTSVVKTANRRHTTICTKTENKLDAILTAPTATNANPEVPAEAGKQAEDLGYAQARAWPSG